MPSQASGAWASRTRPRRIARTSTVPQPIICHLPTGRKRLRHLAFNSLMPMDDERQASRPAGRVTAELGLQVWREPGGRGSVGLTASVNGGVAPRQPISRRSRSLASHPRSPSMDRVLASSRRPATMHACARSPRWRKRSRRADDCYGVPRPARSRISGTDSSHATAMMWQPATPSVSRRRSMTSTQIFLPSSPSSEACSIR